MITTGLHIAIPSPRKPLEETATVAEVTRRRLLASTSTSELRRRITQARVTGVSEAAVTRSL